MTLFHDLTEQRQGTRLPQSVIDQSQPLPGLEQYTGSDLLLSTIRMPPLRLCDGSDLSTFALRKHIASGILIQRKTGRDLTSSITKFPEILQRMQQWTWRSWLLFIGDLKADRDGQAIIDGSETGFTFAAVNGALEYWQMRGGYLSILPRDSLLPVWINGMLERLKKVSTYEQSYVFRPPLQKLIGVPAWVETLATFPNIGHDRARALADHCKTLAGSIEFLTDPIPGVHIDGIGQQTHKLAREYLFSDPDNPKLDPQILALRMTSVTDWEEERKIA